MSTRPQDPGSRTQDPSVQRWVLLETAPWGHRMRLPGHHLARWLSERGARVAYVSVPVSPWHFLSGSSRDLARVRWNQEGARGQWRTPNLFTFIPRTLLPINRSGLFDSEFAWKHSLSATLPGAADVLRKAGFDRPDVIVLQSPLLWSLADSLKPRLRVMAIEDALDEFPGMPRVAIKHLPELIAGSDLVTVTAHELEGWARDRGAREVYYLGNGADVAALANPETSGGGTLSLPADRPIAVYVGALDDWFDEELLAEVARSLPNWHFEIAGPPRLPFDKLRACTNVHFAGPVPPDDVPSLLARATAGLIPFRRTPLIERVAPLKLYEYLAAGLPVVSTRWREIERLDSPATLVSTAAEFTSALTAIERGGHDPAAGRAFAALHDWNAIFSRFSSMVGERLARVR